MVRELALFTGAGGGILGGLLLGWRTVCAVEIDAYCRSVLLARQRDGLLERFPIWDDVCTFDGTPWQGHVDVVSGGFPCQDISSSGPRSGIGGERSGLWSEFARIVGEVAPRHAFVENSPDLTARGLGVILGDLASMGFDARWGVLGASDVGAPHLRRRMWIAASNMSRERCPHETARTREYLSRRRSTTSCNWWSVARFEGMVDGVAPWLDRTRASGNGQVPAVVRLAWNLLTETTP